MVFHNVHIPYGGDWRIPFCKWQGSFATRQALQKVGMSLANVRIIKTHNPYTVNALYRRGGRERAGIDG